MNKLSLKHLQTFLAVIEAGSFRKASEALNLSQPAVTLHVKQLEQVIGLALLNRTTRSMSVTSHGRKLCSQITRTLFELESLVLELRDEAALTRGRLSIACVPTIAASLLPKALLTFEQKFPGISIRVHDVVAEQILVQLADGRSDIGIGPNPTRHSEFNFQLVTKDPFVIIVPRTHPWATKKSIPLSALAGADFLALLPGSNMRDTLETAMASHSLKLVPKYEVQHHYTLGGMVEAGLGITALPSMAVSMLSQPKLRTVPIANSAVAREVGIISSRGKKMSPASAAFIDVFTEIVADR